MTDQAPELLPGPCCICGDTNYSLSCGGPTICPKCDCGHFDAATVLKQAKVIETLRGELERARGLLTLTRPTPSEPVARVREALDKANYRIGWWLSAALEDHNVCTEMKADINAWFEAHQPGLVMTGCDCGGSPGQPPEHHDISCPAALTSEHPSWTTDNTVGLYGVPDASRGANGRLVQFQPPRPDFLKQPPEGSLVLKNEEQSGPVSSPRESERTGDKQI